MDLFELGEDGILYYNEKPLTNRNGELKTIGEIAKALGIKGLREMGFNISKTNLKPRFVLDLLEKQAKLPSSSDIAKADAIELEEIAKSKEDSIFKINNQSQTDDLFEHPLRELLCLDKQLRSIPGSLKVEVAKKVQLEEHVKKERRKLEEFRNYPEEYDDAMREDITKRIDALNEDLKVRQESIDLLKDRLKTRLRTSARQFLKCWIKTPYLVKRSERCLESKELRLLLLRSMIYNLRLRLEQPQCRNIGSLRSALALRSVLCSLLSFYDCAQPASYQLLLSSGSL